MNTKVGQFDPKTSGPGSGNPVGSGPAEGAISVGPAAGAISIGPAGGDPRKIWAGAANNYSYADVRRMRKAQLI